MRWKSQSMSAPYVETFSGSHQFSIRFSALPRRRLGLLLQLEADLGCLAGLHLDLLGLLAESFVPDLHGLLAGRDVLDLHCPVRIGDTEEGRRQDGHPPEHP